MSGCNNCGAPAYGNAICWQCGVGLTGGGGSINPNHVPYQTVPGKPNLTGWAENPMRTVPRTQGVQQTFGYWTGSAWSTLVFQDPATISMSAEPSHYAVNGQWPALVFGETTAPACYRRAVWFSPVFDMRPELAGSASESPIGVPIWRAGAYGQGVRMMLEGQVSGDGTGLDMNMAYVTFQATRVPTDIAPVHYPQHVGYHGDRNDLAGSGLNFFAANFQAPANPVRYWQVAVIFDIAEDPGDTPSPIVKLRASAY